MSEAGFLPHLLWRADTDERQRDRYTPEELAEWPRVEVAAFQAVGVLHPAPPSSWVTCDACFADHQLEVEWAGELGSPTRRAYVVCPEMGLLPVNPSRLQRWRFQLGALARLVAERLGEPSPRELVADRVWWVGQIGVRGVARDVLLGRGMGGIDGTAAQDRAGRARRDPITWLFLGLRRDAHESQTVGAVWAEEVLVWREGRLDVDAQRLVALANAGARAALERRTPGANADTTGARPCCGMEQYTAERLIAFYAERVAQGKRSTMEAIAEEGGFSRSTLDRHIREHLKTSWKILRAASRPA